jgi:ABC-2 type transport system permease protein
MSRIFRFFVRGSAFLRKEIVEVLRQPRLILLLVLGPFLIMLLFGLGYRNEARVLRTIFVVSPDHPIASRVEEFAKNLSPQLDYQGSQPSEVSALAELGNGGTDMVVIVPEDAMEKIQNDQQAIFQVYHNEIDPFQASYIEYVAQLYVAELNKRVLGELVTESQVEAGDVQENLAAARKSVQGMRSALELGDVAASRQELPKLNQNIDLMTAAIGASIGLLGGVQENIGTGGGGTGNPDQEIVSTLDQLNRSRSELGNVQEDSPAGITAEVQRLKEIDGNLEKLDMLLSDFRQIQPYVLVNPFGVEANSITRLNLTPTSYFTPAVIILLLQHLAVTFAALSIVRENNSGAMELFRVSPISAFETLLGKYLSYMLFGGLLAAMISLLVVYGLRVPMLGNWGDYAIVIAALLFAALGAGFIISLISQTDTQAVQYAMLLLLGSIFFSGFFLDLRLMWEPLSALSRILPATYGIQLLQNVMLRGGELNPILIGGLVTISIVVFLLSWLLLHRKMKQV